MHVKRDTLLSASTVHACVHDVHMLYVVCMWCVHVVKCKLQNACCLVHLYGACYVIVMHINNFALMHVLPIGPQANHFRSSAEEERCH